MPRGVSRRGGARPLLALGVTVEIRRQRLAAGAARGRAASHGSAAMLAGRGLARARSCGSRARIAQGVAVRDGPATRAARVVRLRLNRCPRWLRPATRAATGHPARYSRAAVLAWWAARRCSGAVAICRCRPRARIAQRVAARDGSATRAARAVSLRPNGSRGARWLRPATRAAGGHPAGYGRAAVLAWCAAWLRIRHPNTLSDSSSRPIQRWFRATLAPMRRFERMLAKPVESWEAEVVAVELLRSQKLSVIAVAAGVR